MKKLTWLLLCCFACITVGSCTKDEGSEETATQKESMEASEVAGIVGRWKITEWKADHVDQIEMWRIENLTVEFRADGSVESQLVYNNGDERTSGGTWKRSGDNVEINVITPLTDTSGNNENVAEEISPEAGGVQLLPLNEGESNSVVRVNDATSVVVSDPSADNE